MSYIQELRALVGHRPLILVGVLVMVFDERSRLLLQDRTDDQMWDLPGGFMELGETTCPVYVTNDAHGNIQADGHEGSEVRFFSTEDLPGEMHPLVRRTVESFLGSEI
jgi:8-oxo-dGTP pyrophosphatase MutT (NUDIX family)